MPVRNRPRVVVPQSAVTLTSQLSSVSHNGLVHLVIACQPEQQHRARYQTEGSRGAVKDRTGNGFPVVKVIPPSCLLYILYEAYSESNYYLISALPLHCGQRTVRAHYCYLFTSLSNAFGPSSTNLASKVLCVFTGTTLKQFCTKQFITFAEICLKALSL